MRVIEACWPAPAAVSAGTTTRQGGVSTGPYATLNLGAHVGDDPDAVTANRQQLIRHLALEGEPRWLNQVHGANVVQADSAMFTAGPPAADAVVCRNGNAVLAILTADCLPVLLCDTESPGIAAIHCGWRGLAAGIIEATVEAMNVDTSGLMAWLGPAISQRAFEVGDEVRDLFLAGIEDAARCFEPNAKERWQADLYGLARLYLARTGISRIYGGAHCTFGDAGRFFSYRRDGQCGRMASFICRHGA